MYVLVLKLRNFCHDRTQCAWLENWINTVVWDDNSRLKETGGASDGMTTLNFALSFSTFFWYLSSSSRVSMTTWFLWFCHAKFDNICGDFLCVGLASASCLLTTISPKRNKKTVQIKSWFFIWTCLLQIIMLQYHYIVQTVCYFLLCYNYHKITVCIEIDAHLLDECLNVIHLQWWMILTVIE